MTEKQIIQKVRGWLRDWLRWSKKVDTRGALEWTKETQKTVSTVISAMLDELEDFESLSVR